MEEGSGGGGVGGEASSSSPIVLCGGGRQRFEVELRPGETTIVSWKKLMKDAEKAAKNNNDSKSSSVSAASVPPVPVSVPVPIAANPALDSRIAPPSGETAENEGNDAPPGSRFSAVIEKIERLYMGKNSSDEEDLNDVPDDDEYDTEDSFIDDAELDDYFQVDNSAIKHDGFFVNRGKLERTNEPTALPTEQPKKRRRKDPTKGINENNIPNKQIKVNKKEGKKLVTSADKNPIVPNVNSEDVKYQSPIIALGTVVKKPSDSKNPSPTRVFQGDAKVTVTAKITDKQKPGILQSKKHVSKLKDGKPSNDVQLKSQGQIGNNSEDLNQSVSLKEKNVVHQQTDNKASEIAQTPKTVRKEGSSTKPRSTNLVLEKAISDLEKTVAETRPASMEVSEGDNSSQAVKRRMPPEIKQKLAKVARVAHGINGKVSKELLNRLMSIVGHLIQIRSLKRNLENMVVSGLSAKEEKNGKLQQLKKEVDEMVKIRAPLMKPEAGIGSSDDFQEAVKTKFTTDDALEDKICDLYDLFVDGLDEDAGPHQLRKLYVELAELWPKGCMDNHGIKRAICRAKERKKTLFRHKDQEKMKRKKLVAPKPEVNPVSVADSITTVRSISNTLAANITTRPPGPTTEKTKQEKLKGSSSSANNQNNTTVSEVLVKKKTKRKPDAELADGQTRPEKSNKQMTVKPTPVVTTTTTVAPPAQPQPQVVDNSSVDLG